MGWEDELAEQEGSESENPYETGTRDFQDELVAEIAAGGGDRSLLEYQLDSYRTRAITAAIVAVMGVFGVISAVGLVVALLIQGRLSILGVGAGIVCGAMVYFGTTGLFKNIALHRELRTKLESLPRRAVR